MHVVNENENRNENTCKNEEKTLTKILKTKTKTIIESKTKLLVKTKIVQLTENSHSVFSVQQVDSVQPSSSNRAKPALPEAKFTLLPDFKLCCTFTSLYTMNIKEISVPSRRTVDDEMADYVSAGLSVKPNDVSVAALIDPQHFWLQNISKYPTLGHLALDLISAPASEAYTEWVFSYCGLQSN